LVRRMIMGVIKGVLKEELENSIDMLKRYQEEIAKIKGCLIRKKIGKRYYYYLVRRQGKKVKFIYKGPISDEVKKAYVKQRKMLNKYKKLLSQVKNQIKFIKRALRGKEAV
jgi:DNA repair exonuclease SbcCD ATPase subunit